MTASRYRISLRGYTNVLKLIWWRLHDFEGFPGCSGGKESSCNIGDHSSVPGSGRSPGEGLGSPLQYPWASLVAQLVKNLPAMWETCDRSLGWEDPLEEGMTTHSSILNWRIPMDRGAWWAAVHGVAESQRLSAAQHTTLDMLKKLNYTFRWVRWNINYISTKLFLKNQLR